MTGTTGYGRSVTGWGDVAAMKPRRDDGDDHHRRAHPDRVRRAAMKPRRDDGDDLREVLASLKLTPPQ